MKKSKLLSLGTGLAVSLSTFIVANANANPFQAETLKAGYDNLGYQITKTTAEDGSCGAGVCGNGDSTDSTMNDAETQTDKSGDGSCAGQMEGTDKSADGDCGADMETDKAGDASCGAGDTSADKATDGRCGLSGQGQ